MLEKCISYAILIFAGLIVASIGILFTYLIDIHFHLPYMVLLILGIITGCISAYVMFKIYNKFSSCKVS